MRSGAAHIEVVDGGAVVSPTGYGTKKEELFERQLALEDVALCQAELALEVKRRENLTTDNNFFDIGGVLGNGVDDGIAEGFALLVPSALRQFVRGVLNEAGENVLARGSDGRIREAGNNDVYIRAARIAAVCGIVVGAFHVF